LALALGFFVVIFTDGYQLIKFVAPWGSWVSSFVALFAVTAGWRFVKAYERRQWHNQKLTEKRIKVFDDTAFRLNDFLCFFIRVGNWKELSPPELVSTKRFLDKTFDTYRYLFSDQFWNAYDSFIHECFKTFVGSGKDAKLRVPPRDTLPNWKAEWSECHCKNCADFADPASVNQRYVWLMEAFASEIGIARKMFGREFKQGRSS
jgi:hypothetical protein